MNNNYFTFQYKDDSSCGNLGVITVVFIHQQSITNFNAFSQEIDVFFQEHALSDKIVVIFGKYLEQKSKDFIIKTPEEAFKRVPGRSKDFFDKNLLVYSFDAEGSMVCVKGKTPKNEKEFHKFLLRSGSTILFKNNGGLVESTPDHHFVFPSGKHCSRFLRTGNVLINHPEIFYLSFQLLPKLKETSYIYCDTASINALPYTLFELKRRFGQDFVCPLVYSFKSYDLFEDKTSSFPPDSLILISSSTSGGIIVRMLEKELVSKSQICLLYFLGSNSDYRAHAEQIICNLTKELNFDIGLDVLDSFKKNELCKFCDENSRPIPIKGDVFLTVQPQVNLLSLKTIPEYAPKAFPYFIEKFRGFGSSENTILKVYYKDDTNGKENYEIYIDYAKLIENIERFGTYKKSLDKCIDKCIPANSKVILTLPDVGSRHLADYILTQTSGGINPKVIKFEDNWVDELNGINGTIVIVASCISSGKKMLQISRLLRKFPNLCIVYFIGIFRPPNENYSKTLSSNLSKGSTPSDSSPVIAVETIKCSNKKKNTPWAREKDYIDKVITEIDEESDAELDNYLNQRRNTLLNAKIAGGLSNDIFLKTLNGKDLLLNKNFAFWEFDYEEKEVAQSELYFQISAILNKLFNKEVTDHPSLNQTNYVRNLLSPGNFSRFNDGIIQAALLRAGDSSVFSYDLDKSSSQEMKEQLLSMLEKLQTDDSEALPEFMLAIGLKKLKLFDEDLIEFLNKAIGCENKIISRLAEYILAENSKN
ncbi:hypothetical protein [Lacihabitans sp. CS3-21]|uniref:hypothetical protein n=1 Tax=Lacihabitans sp. CS3-21 TaxID=2487332 RepID=UPI0020CBABC0|nr:hypothetical protein [Lacihabitans sp. CS3-21]MCP9745983.1 hypothetical protein [Lacihabitans sp. CS3-21]